MTNPASESTPMRALHVRTGEPAFNACVLAWLSEHAVESIACDDPFQAVVHLTNHPETIPDLVFVGLDWLVDEDLRLLNFLHESWPAATLVTYVHEIRPRVRAPIVFARECHGIDDLARVLAQSPAALARGTDDAQSSASPLLAAAPTPIAAPMPRAAPPLARVPDLPPPRPAPAAESPDNPPTPPGPLPRTVSRPADLLTREELAALLNQDFR